MNKKVIISLIVIVMMAAAIGGATMAWFSDEAPLGEAEFVAGTVKVSADGETKVQNVNPGQEESFEFCIENEGSKSAYVRMRMDARWSPGPLRPLVVYKDGIIQLIAVEWDSFCKGCTGKTGHIAEVDFIVRWPYDQGYFKVELSNVVNIPADKAWLVDGEYSGYCSDAYEVVNQNELYEGAKVFDPFCNANWYDELGLTVSSDQYERFKAIDFDAISYILNRDYLARGYHSDAIQTAIWTFTNPQTPDFTHFSAPEFEGYLDIVYYVNDNLSAALNTTDNIVFDITNGDWEKIDGYYYYKAILPAYVENSNAHRICLTGTIKFTSGVDNKFQGMEYRINTWVEAIQTTNEAYLDSDLGWGWNPSE